MHQRYKLYCDFAMADSLLEQTFEKQLDNGPLFEKDIFKQPLYSLLFCMLLRLVGNLVG